MKRIFFSFLLAILLAGCAVPTPPAPVVQRVEVEVTRVMMQTVVVTQIVERVITATPEPPTPTPIVTPTPVFERWTTSQVLEAFKAAQLQTEPSRPMTNADFGVAPNVAKEGIRFVIPSLCADCGGRIFAFDDPYMLAATKKYYETLGEKSKLYFSWVFVRDNYWSRSMGICQKRVQSAIRRL